MRILALRGENLASLAAPFAIDFTAAPLKDAGVYAICGPTGAGKSTLLDALCLALYHRTPRLDDGPAASLADVAGESVRAKDPRQWLRRGAVSGFAEVDFVGIDGLHWRARWAVKRARSKPDGRLQAAEASLLQIESGERRGRTISEVREEIKACIGLDFAQFTRAVLLAQNQFARFLSAEPNERAELLEALTGAQLYSRLSRAAFERARESQAALTTLEASFKAYTPLSDEQRGVLQTALDSSAQAEQQLHNALLPVHAGLSWQAERAQREQQLTTAQAELRAASEDWEAQSEARAELTACARAQDARPWVERTTQYAADAARRQTEHLQATQTEQQHARAAALAEQALQQASAAEQQASLCLREARPILKQARELDQQLLLVRAASDQSGAALQAQRQQLGLVQCELQQHESARQALVQSIAIQRDWFAAHNADGVLAEHFTRLDLLLEQLLTLRTECATAHATRELLRDDWRRSSQSLEASNRALGEARTQVLAAAQSEESARTQLTELDPPGLQRAQHYMASAQHTLLQSRQAVTDLYRCQLAQERAQAALEQLQQQQALQRSAIAVLEIRLPELAGSAQRARELWQRASDHADQHTAVLRSRLQPEQPCPVCGAQSHPYVENTSAVDPVLTAVLHELQQATDTADQQLRLAGEELHMQQGLLRQATQVETERGAVLHEARQQHAAAAAQLRQCWAYGELPEPLHDPVLLDTLAEHATQIDTRIAALALRQQAVAQLQRTLDQAQQTQAAARAALEHLQILDQQTRAAHASIEARGQWQASECARLERALRHAQDELQAHAAWPVELDVRAIDADTRALLRQRSASWTQQQADLNAALQALGEVTQRIEALQQRIALELQPALDVLGHAHGAANAQVQQIQQQRSALSSERDTEAWQLRLEALLETAQQQLDVHRAAAASSQAAQIDAAVQLAVAIQASTDAQHQLEASDAALDQWLAEQQAAFPAVTWSRSRLLQQLAMTPSELAHRTATMAGLHERLQRSQLHAEHAIRRLQDWCIDAIEYPDTSALNASKILLDAQLRQLLQDRGALQEQFSADQRLRAQQTALHQALQSARETQRIWAQLSELIGSADGAKFRRLAQQYTLDLVLAYTNVHLRELAARYQLRREDDNLLVADRDLGGAIRAVSSLSGGETFLVSLALALGLASLTAQRLRIESLFIDEGFGALDEHSLRQALDALDRLQAQGRKIGVISHLAELTERVGTRIEVRRVGHGASVVEVRG